MAWIELHQALWTHRKTLCLADLLDIDETYAGAHLARLWTWALDNVGGDGDISGMSARAIAVGAGWKGDPGEFYQALVTAEWIDADGDRRALHDWQEYAGRLLEVRARNAQRARNARVRNANGAGLQNPTVPNRTEPNRTQPEERASAPEPPPPPDGNPWDELEGERLDVFREWSRALNERLVLEDVGLAEDLVRIVGDHKPQEIREAVKRIRKRNDRPYPRQMLEALGVPQVVTNGRSRSREPDEYALPGYGGPT